VPTSPNSKPIPKPQPGDQVICIKTYDWNGDIFFKAMNLYSVIDGPNDNIHVDRHQHVTLGAECPTPTYSRSSYENLWCMDFDDGIHQKGLQHSVLFNTYFIPLKG
jgi:hypothetical protein